MYMYMNSERLGAHNHTIGQLELIIYNSVILSLVLYLSVYHIWEQFSSEVPELWGIICIGPAIGLFIAFWLYFRIIRKKLYLKFSTFQKYQGKRAIFLGVAAYFAPFICSVIVVYIIFG